MLIFGRFASGPQIAPTVPPEKYGQAAMGLFVRDAIAVISFGALIYFPLYADENEGTPSSAAMR